LPLRGTSAPARTPSLLRATGAPRRYVSSGARWRKSGPSLRRPILKPRKIAVKGARYRSRRFAQTPDRESCRGFSGAYRRDGQVRAWLCLQLAFCSSHSLAAPLLNCATSRGKTSEHCRRLVVVDLDHGWGGLQGQGALISACTTHLNSLSTNNVEGTLASTQLRSHWQCATDRPVNCSHIPRKLFSALSGYVLDGDDGEGDIGGAGFGAVGAGGPVPLARITIAAMPKPRAKAPINTKRGETGSAAFTRTAYSFQRSMRVRRVRALFSSSRSTWASGVGQDPPQASHSIDIHALIVVLRTGSLGQQSPRRRVPMLAARADTVSST
jgi:hypothetical protein